MRRFGVLVLVILLAIGLFWIYKQHEANLAANGEVTSHDSGSSEESRTPDLDGRTGSDSGTTVSSSTSPMTNAEQNQTTAPVQTQPPRTGTIMPAADTVSPNPPNGLAFGGTGRYQWYRQGNLTWRVDTGSGEACVAFATMDEWRKPIVYSHGCANS